MCNGIGELYSCDTGKHKYMKLYELVQSLHVKQRRNLLDNKLNNYKQEKLKRKLPKYGQLLEYAKEDIEMKKRLVNHIEIMEEHYQDCDERSASELN
ncbi:hypothetical protein pdam_00022715 [Pocillopora damicornis]|uniref:Uncharacterized protein n=1 Tax=Pocillopora damicornis TaxID=46731 RepID=A0A3M6UPK2_POCDA|nr:hypothetical protein pdam_00022715 [Pocillopora damicornis]